MPAPVTLQINLAPSDHRLAATLLSHQVSFWNDAVAEVLLTIDTRRSRGRFGSEWEIGRSRIFEIANRVSNARVVEVNYSPGAQNAVADMFFGGRRVPLKDCRGGPYYSYFFGLYSAHYDWVLHADADMLFGGSAEPWLSTATKLYERNPEIIFTAPLSGPPAMDGKLRQLDATPETIDSHAGFAFREMSTRVFLVKRTRLRASLCPFRPRPPLLRARLLAHLESHPAFELPEIMVSRAMEQKGLKRFDFSGPAPGCWTLHPPYRCRDFYEKLPSLITRVEEDDIPIGQQGDHDLNNSMVDWSEAITAMAKQRWWHRLLRRIRDRP